MRIHGYLNNKTNRLLRKEKRKKGGSKRKKQKKETAKREKLSKIDYLKFMSDEQIKKLESSKCTKLLTGKRQRKIMKRLRHAAREKNEEVQFADNAEASSSKEVNSDVEMKET